MARIRIRYMGLADTQAVSHLMAQTVKNPMTELLLRDFLSRQGQVGLVAEWCKIWGDRICGWLLACCQLREHHCEIMSLGVLPSRQRCRVASHLIADLQRTIGSISGMGLVAVAPEENLPVQLLLKARGFYGKMTEQGILFAWRSRQADVTLSQKPAQS